MITRRQALTALVGGMVLSKSDVALSQNAKALQADTQTPLILRKYSDGADPRYVLYSQPGPYTFPAAPSNLSTGLNNVLVFVPSGVSSARLIVFSHDILATPLSYRSLLWHWASHGFIVIAPLHTDAVIEDGSRLRDKSEDGTFIWSVNKVMDAPGYWRQRLEDCTSCFGLVDLVEKATKVKVDLSRPIIAGHGYGAFIAQMAMGAKISEADGSTSTARDKRFSSGIMLSPQGDGVLGLTESSWANIAEPMLNILAEYDEDFTGQDAKQKGRAYQLAKAGYKHLGYVADANQSVFNNVSASLGARETKSVEAIKALTTVFLYSYAHYDTQAFDDLKTKFVERMSLGGIKEFYR